MPIKLRVTDTDGNIIKEDNLEISNSDVLLIELGTNIRNNHKETHRVIARLIEAFKAQKRDPNGFVGFVYPKGSLSFKIIKVVNQKDKPIGILNHQNMI